MRFLCALLSIYVMLMSVMTCKDGLVLENSKTQIVLTQDTDHAETPADLCSPFCTCTCCVGITQPVVTATQSVLLSSTDLEYPAVKKELLKNHYNLFQPPKFQA